MSKKKERDFTPKHFVLLLFAVLIIALAFIGIMNWQGYFMIDMKTEYLLFGVLIVGAMLAGLVFLVNRLMNKILKFAVGALGAVVIILAAATMMAFFSAILKLQVPKYYTTLKSPAGKSVAVMCEWGDDEKAKARAQQRWTDDPEAEEGVYIFEDHAYSYFAAPRVLGIFYDTNQMSEGSLEIGVNSEAQLMYKWEGEKLTMYIENAEESDSGEITLNLE